MTETTADGTSGSPLRQRMIDQMRTANFADSTRASYIGEIEQLAKHYKASPADLDADQVRAWVLHGIDRGLKGHRDHRGSCPFLHSATPEMQARTYASCAQQLPPRWHTGQGLLGGRSVHESFTQAIISFTLSYSGVPGEIG